MHRTAPQRFYGVILLFALAVGGCAGTPPPPLPSGELRARIGTLGLVALPFEETIDPEMPTKGAGEGAAAGAKQGGLALVYAGCVGGYAPGCAIGVALAPVGALVGAGVGAARARTPAEVEAAQASLVAALKTVRPNIELRDRVARYARRHVVVKAPADTGEPPAAGRAGADTVLELRKIQLGVITLGEISPSLKVTLGVRGILVRAADGRVIYVRSWVYRGEGRNYFELAADSGARLNTELEQAYDKLAEKIVHDLFVAAVPAPEEREEDGTAWAVEATELAGRLALMDRAGTCLEGQKIVVLRLDGKKLPDERSDLTLSPGRRQIALVCGLRRKHRCGRLDFVAEPGVVYRLYWPAPDRLSMIDVRTGRAAGVAETWSERLGWFDSTPCAD